MADGNPREAAPVKPISWGAEPEFFGPRHAFREEVLLAATAGWDHSAGWFADAAAGLGSFTRKMAEKGFRTVAVDRSWESLLHHRRMARERGLAALAPPVLADVTRLPFRDGALAGIVTAETIEHLDEDRLFASELGRVVRDGGGLAVSTPADPGQWSDWDVWAEHRRRYRRSELESLFRDAGFGALDCRSFGFPVVRIYDAIFLRRLIRKRARGGAEGTGARRSPIVRFALSAGRSPLAVGIAVALFRIDRLFERLDRGVGWTMSGRRAAR